ncbi:MAG: TIGR02996 domain-containing protein [Myxococcota bacterium]
MNDHAHSEFLDQIAGAPDDDGLRLVYADWLSERGDPRGEFIVLQCKRASGRLSGDEAMRERDLLSRNKERWLGPLAEVIDPDSAVFRRGFLSECRARFRSGAQKQRLLGHPMWATVERLAGDVDVLAHRGMYALRSVGPISLDTLRALTWMPAQSRVSEVCLDLADRLPDELVRDIPDALRLSGIRDLVLRFPAAFKPFNIINETFHPDLCARMLRHPQASGLSSLTVHRHLTLSYIDWAGFDRPYPDLALWGRSLPSFTGLSQRISLQPCRGWTFSLVPGPDGWLLGIDWNTACATGDLKGLQLPLRDVEPSAFALLELSMSGPYRPAHLEALRHVLADRFPLVSYPDH